MAAPDHDTHGDVGEKSVQDRLIEAAEELFCRRGFNETSVRDIAAGAGCNVASVNYYFGGKDNLYLEVWRRRLAFMRDTRLASIEKVMSASNRPQLEDLLRSYAVSFIEPLIDGSPHCRFINLMAREMIDPHLPKDMYVTEMVSPVLDAFREALLEICPWLDTSECPHGRLLRGRAIADAHSMRQGDVRGEQPPGTVQNRPRRHRQSRRRILRRRHSRLCESSPKDRVNAESIGI